MLAPINTDGLIMSTEYLLFATGKVAWRELLRPRILIVFSGQADMYKDFRKM